MNKLKLFLRWLFSINEVPVGSVRATTRAVYCLDCIGDDKLPHKTFLTTDGRCDNCHGRQYLLASSFAPLLAARLKRDNAMPEYSDLIRRDEWEVKDVGR